MVASKPAAAAGTGVLPLLRFGVAAEIGGCTVCFFGVGVRSSGGPPRAEATPADGGADGDDDDDDVGVGDVLRNGDALCTAGEAGAAMPAEFVLLVCGLFLTLAAARAANVSAIRGGMPAFILITYSQLTPLKNSCFFNAPTPPTANMVDFADPNLFVVSLLRRPLSRECAALVRCTGNVSFSVNIFLSNSLALRC